MVKLNQQISWAQTYLINFSVPGKLYDVEEFYLEDILRL